MTVTDIYEIQAIVRDQASGPLLDVRSGITQADEAAAGFWRTLKVANEGMQAGAQHAEGYSEQIQALSRRYNVSAERLGHLERTLKDSNDVYEEAGQKLLDARKRLDEYGASAQEQAEAVDLLFTAAERSNLPLAKQALVLEELAIEFQDGRRALDFYEEGLRLVEKRGGRAEDAIADLTAAAKGDTGALNRLGPAARAAASGLDDISDEGLRASKVLEIFRRENSRLPTALDRVNDRMAIARSEFALVATRVGPLLTLLAPLGLAFGAGLALGVDKATDAVKAFIDTDKDLQRELKLMEARSDSTEVTLGRLISKVLELDKVYQGLDRTTGETGDALEELERRFDSLSQTGKDNIETLLGALVLASGQGGLLTFYNQTRIGAKAQEEFNDQILANTTTVERYTAVIQGLNQAIADTGTVNAGEIIERAGQVRRQASLRRSGGKRREVDVVGLLEQAQEEEIARQERAQDLLYLIQDAALERSTQELDKARELIAALDEVAARQLQGVAQESLPGLARQARVGDLLGRLGRGPDSDDLDFDDAGIEHLEDLAELEIDPVSEEGLERLERMIAQAEALNGAFTNLARSGLAQAIGGTAQFVGQLAAGQAQASDFGAFWLSTFGNIVRQTGQGFIVMGLGALEIQRGLTSPGGLIAIGSLAVAAGSAMVGLASSSVGRPSASSGAAQVSATQDAFREATDRLLATDRRERQPIYNFFEIDGEVIQGVVERSNRRLAASGVLGQLVGV